VGASQRFAGLPGTPTVAESGIPGYHASSWMASACRPGLRVRSSTGCTGNSRRRQRADVKQKLQEMGVDAKAYTPPRRAS